MKKIWKWILGIVVVLVIIAGVVGVAFLVRNNPNIFAFPSGTAPFHPGFNRPNAPNGGMPGGGYGWRGPMMRRPGFSHYGWGFGPFGMFMPFGFSMFLLVGLFRLLIPLGVLVLVAIVFYELGKKAGASTGAPVVVPTAPDPRPTSGRGRKVAKS